MHYYVKRLFETLISIMIGYSLLQYRSYRKFLHICGIAYLIIATTGCAILIPVAATTTAGSIALSDRSTGEIIDDSGIVAKIKTELATSDYNNLLTKISINSYEGRVMLTGTLKSQNYIDEAVKISWSIHGVKEVINELTVAPTRDS